MLFKDKIDSYLNSVLFGSSYGITLIYIEKLLIGILILIYYEHLSNNKTNIILINSFFIYITTGLLFSEIFIVVARLSVLFIYSYWLLLPLIIKNSSTSNKYLLIILLFLLTTIKTNRNTDYVMYKYDNILFQNHDSYKNRKKVYQIYSKKILNGHS